MSAKTGRLRELGVYLVLGAITASTVYLIRASRALAEQNRLLARRAVDPRPGLYVPSLDATTLEGTRVVLGELGQRQVMFFFNRTCPYCRASLPGWNAIAARLGRDSGVRVYGIAFDSIRPAAAYAKDRNLRFPVVARPDPRMAGLYRVSRVPLVLVINEEGRMEYVRIGALEAQSAIDSVVRAALRTGNNAAGSTDRTRLRKLLTPE